ncbi:putative mitochondrial histidyl-tRNA synthetase precursor [Cladorrhinum samala]|uniref:Histidine--tRNA ligase, mitochondrial n=1 Tax=Cladorrhinum samala TaxID=585594 RepID=A0AAV9HZE2_9PEZI|nr:putative mitochondrial histidyl-tRNA synthetase precursor [Cladorrhinum samala]
MQSPWILAIRSARPQRRLTSTLKARTTCLSLPVLGSRRLLQTSSNRPQSPSSAVSSDMAPKAPKFEIKTPKGTRDWSGPDMVLREKIFTTITNVFKRHGGVTIDTPVFELKEILAGKYGEDSKLIYDLADQGGEICSLRYDLTVPFARFLAMNKDITQIKRYHLAKVYRRDQPAVKKGRMREFYQCDFDIAGVYDPMIPDAEIIRIINEVFEGLGWKGKYTIKLNSRKILDGIFQVCGVPDNLIRPVSSAVDKLDKMPWEDVRKEMVDEKGLAPEAADKIGQYVILKGKRDLLEQLQKDEALSANASMQQGFADMALLFDYLDAFGAAHSVSFDLSLARGLDYYTGIIYEVVTEGSAPTVSSSDAAAEKAKKKKGKPGDADEDRSDDPTVGIGSVAAGGRYDNLVGMFSGKTQVPCVGISFGIDRIFSIMRANQAKKDRKNEVDVFVMAFGGGKDFTGLLKERSQVCARLWDAGIKAEFLYKVKPKLQNQFKAAENNGVPFALILGEDELAQGKVRLKEMGLPEDHPLKEGELISFENLTQEVQARLDQKKRLDSIAEQAGGLRVVGGIKGEDIKASVAAETAQPASGESSETTVA